MLISNFLKYEFDLLIDLSQLYHFLLMYIATASIAIDKVGLSKMDLNIYDSLISNTKNKSLNGLILNIKHNLKYYEY